MGKAAAPRYWSKVSRVGLAVVTMASQESRFPRQVHGEEADPGSSQEVSLGVSQVPDQQGYTARHRSHSMAQVGSQPRAQHEAAPRGVAGPC